MSKAVALTGNEKLFSKDDLIVSKTNLKGHITYCNRLFIELSGYSEKELLNQPHSIIRHPHMPRCVFDLLWETLQNGHEIFAYVINRSKNGDHYWVNAHVTPSRDNSENIIGYHSNRRVPDRKVLEDKVIPLYDQLLEIEQKHNNRKEGMKASRQAFNDILASKNMRYDEFVARL